jgi:hypothetical protein
MQIRWIKGLLPSHCKISLAALSFKSHPTKAIAKMLFGIKRITLLIASFERACLSQKLIDKGGMIPFGLSGSTASIRKSVS